MTQKGADLSTMTLTLTSDDVLHFDPTNKVASSNVSQPEPLLLHGMDLEDFCYDLTNTMTFQGAYNLVGSLCVAVGIGYFILWMVKERNFTLRPTDKDSDDPLIENRGAQKGSKLFMTIFVVYAFAQAGCETAYGNYLFAYITEGVGLSKVTASHVLSVHWTSRVVGYIIGTLVSYSVPAIAIVCGSIIMVIAFLILHSLVGACNTVVMWACVVFIGFGQSLLTPTILSWLDKKTTVSHRACSLLMVLNHLGALVFSTLTGLVLTYDSFFFNILIAISYSVCLVLFINVAVITFYSRVATSPLAVDANANVPKEEDRQCDRTPKRTTLRHGSMLYAPHLRPRFSVAITNDQPSHSQLLRFACLTVRPAPFTLQAATKYAYNYETETL